LVVRNHACIDSVCRIPAVLHERRTGARVGEPDPPGVRRRPVNLRRLSFAETSAGAARTRHFVARSLLSVLGLCLTIGAANMAQVGVISRLLTGHGRAPQQNLDALCPTLGLTPWCVTWAYRGKSTVGHE
jgi:hypothetical protein